MVFRMLSDNKSDPTLTSFWNKMAHELFQNVEDLYQQIETQFSERPSEEGPGAQMAVSSSITEVSKD